ncbi:hypothetical protein AB8Q18_04315 [Neisseriaceae bacterium CLB008]|nr:hypothetical protein [Neisseriaceae bacterium]
MNLRLVPATLLTTLLITGCSSTGGAFDQFANLLNKAMPFVQESEEWEAYSIQMTQQGVSYGTATAADKQFVSKKIEAEYPAAIDRLSRPFAANAKMEQELTQNNQNYRFKYNQVMPVKSKKSGSIIGYCVNYDVNRLENGKPTAPDAAGNVTQHFIYAAKDKPLSVATSSHEFTKRMCGETFFKKYKNPNT